LLETLSGDPSLRPQPPALAFSDGAPHEGLIAERTATIDTANMATNADTLKALVEAELAQLGDARVMTHIRSLLIEPTPILRDWNYGDEGQKYMCWSVLEHKSSNTGIAYCEEGFGPRSPWGLVALQGSHMSMGMDSGWFTTFLQGFFDSAAATELAIWRVFRTDKSGVRIAITPERGWDEAWKQVMELRREDPASNYGCDTSIMFERE
jgi:hypothetical protein